MFGVTSSPFLLNATLKHHVEQYVDKEPEFVRRLTDGTYVDDVNVGGKTDDDVYMLYLNSKLRLADAGFNLRKFVTNSPDLHRRIQRSEASLAAANGDTLIPSDDEVTFSESSLDTMRQTGDNHKVLGVEWNYVQDTLVYNMISVASIAEKMVPSKRNIAGMAARFFDPLGFLAPVVLQFKLLFRDMCQEQMAWDDVISEPLRQRWEKLVKSLRYGPAIEMPRCVTTSTGSAENKTFCLRGFGDAANNAYGAVIYLCVSDSAGREVKFLASKTKVAPTTAVSIPRLELLAAVLLAQLMVIVIEALRNDVSIADVLCYTDSRVVWHWITEEGREWKQFVRNRVQEIRSAVHESSWRHCPGRDNPADIASRGCTLSELASSAKWKEGPEWLKHSDGNDMAADAMPDSMPDACREEMTAKERQVVDSAATLTATQTSTGIGELIASTRYSNYGKLLSVTAHVLKATQRFKMTRRERDANDARVTADDISSAEKLWIQDVQDTLPAKKQYSSWSSEFGLYNDDDGLIRCGGRLQNSELPVPAKHPYLLNKEHHVTKLIVEACHRQVLHSGVKATLTELRAQFWIVKGRQFVRRVIHSCVKCRRVDGKAYTGPQQPPLPSFRVQESQPFANSGVDYAGPLFVGADKVWICLFTCCVTRAVHLELVTDLSTSAFLLAFRRFTAKRGPPTMMLSDNATTFKAAAEKLTRVHWKFNVEKAPWWGGIFERLIKSMKSSLKKVLGNARLSMDELTTVVAEVERTLNSRPLTYVSSEDLDEPLTPSHLLCGRRLGGVADNIIQADLEYDLTPGDAHRRLQHLNSIMSHFWNRWRREYLTELRNVHRT